LAGRTLSPADQEFGNIVGFSLIVLGTAIIAVAAARFLITAKQIDSDQLYPSTGARIDLALAALLVLLGFSLVLYLSHAFVAKL
jgi:uncharacterized membrane protein YidH (DUF202 family)